LFGIRFLVLGWLFLKTVISGDKVAFVFIFSPQVFVRVIVF